MNRKELGAVVRALSFALEVDDTIQEVCPCCEGGVSREPSLSISRRNEGVLYNCYRAGCGFRGFEGGMYYSPITSKKKKLFKPKKFTAPTGYLSPPHYKFWQDTFELDAAMIDRNGILRIHERDSYMMPTMNEHGYVTGCVDRAFWGRKPKTILYKFMDTPSLAFAHTIHSLEDKPLLVVEDMPSAIKAAKFMPTVALLGTNISEKEVNYLKKVTDNIWLALDEDATDKAIAYKRKYNLYFRNFRVLPLVKDIKDMKYTEIEELL